VTAADWSDLPLFVCYGDFRVGVLRSDGAVLDVCSAAHDASAVHDMDHPRQCLPAALASWPDLAVEVTASTPVPKSAAQLKAPIPRPVNVFGAPVNYLEHQGELGEMRSPAKGTVRELGLFVKAAGSVSGPDSPILLPDMPGREFHYEGEIALVIGRGGQDLDATQARAAIAGVTAALDITLRLEEDHREERSMRKSYRTFTPIGPAVLPLGPDGPIEELSLTLSLNGEVRQRGQLSQLVASATELVQLASSVVCLLPGDLILTGTPAGVGPLEPGDRIEVVVDGLPALALDVKASPA
jgi:2-keto-4-pentenoate hydratase/2-oxohepta-3-ene-1,7-dioic acid hydratase in catechol pathway